MKSCLIVIAIKLYKYKYKYKDAKLNPENVFFQTYQDTKEKCG